LVCCGLQESLAPESRTPSVAEGSSVSKLSRGTSRLDAELKDAINLVRVSDQKIGALRKMHAQYLLKRWGSCLTPLQIRFLKGCLKTYRGVVQWWTCGALICRVEDALGGEPWSAAIA
jgi:hypothetical protein